jgi:hypothetical protein
MPTIREAIKNALEALSNTGFPKGGAVYDDLEQVLNQLGEEGDLLDYRLEQ